MNLDPNLVEQAQRLMPPPDEQPLQGNLERQSGPHRYNPDLWLYRDRTVSLLKRYLRMSVEVGRLPSLLGREFFRSKVSSTRVSTFEDAVIFVHDMSRSLEQLEEFEQQLIATVVLQDYTQEEAAERLHCQRKTIRFRFCEAVDRLSELLLLGGWITPIPKMGPEPCQEGEEGQQVVSDSNYNENIFQTMTHFTL